jgi:hypothetical protein
MDTYVYLHGIVCGVMICCEYQCCSAEKRRGENMVDVVVSNSVYTQVEVL